MKNTILIIAFVCTQIFAQSQTADSLLQALSKAKESEKVNILNQLFDQWIDEDPVKAIGYTHEALLLASELDDKIGKAKAYSNMGLAYKEQGALDKSLEYLTIADTLFRDLKVEDEMAGCMSNIGTIYSLKGDYELALRYYQEALKIFESFKDSKQIVRVLNNIGDAHSDLGRFPEALKAFENAVALSSVEGQIPPDLYLNLGDLYLHEAQHAKAIEFYDKALNALTPPHDHILQINIHTSMGKAWFELGDLKKSEKNLTEALAVSETHHVYVYEPAIYKSLAATYAREGRMKDAYESMLKFENSREKIFNEESNRKIDQMEMVIGIQEKEKQILTMKKDEAIRNFQVQRTQLGIILVIISIITIMLLVNIFIQKTKSARRK